MKFFTALIFILLLGACGKQNGIPLAPYLNLEATPENFNLCHGYGCNVKTPVSFSEEQWAEILSVFRPSPSTAEDERKAIAKAISLMEQYSNKATGLEPDRGEARTIRDHISQMDCIDETVNTNQYLKFLQQVGALKLHEPAPPVHVGHLIDFEWPHNSAAIRNKKTGEIYAVDSYFFDNGKQIVVLPLEDWPQGWRDYQAADGS